MRLDLNSPLLTDAERERRGADALKSMLEDQRVIFKPW